jgi:hypothetical protein
MPDIAVVASILGPHLHDPLTAAFTIANVHLAQ